MRRPPPSESEPELIFGGGGGGGGSVNVRQPPSPNLHEFGRDFDAHETASEPRRRHARAGGAGERVENQVAGVRSRPQTAVYERDWLLGRMLAEALFVAPRRREAPDGLHLLAAVFAAHLVVVEGVLVAAALRRLARPQDDFGRVSERPPSQIRRWVGLLPDYVVEQPKAVRLKRHAHAGIHVERPRHPYRAVRLQNAVTLRRPAQVEIVVGFQPLAAVPLALVHAHHAPGDAGNPVVREKIGRIRPHAIHALVGDAGEQVERVSPIQRGAVIRRRPSGRRIGYEATGGERRRHALIVDRIMRSCQVVVSCQWSVISG